MSQENEIKSVPGALMFPVLLGSAGVTIWAFIQMVAHEDKSGGSPMPWLGYFLASIVFSLLIMPGFFVNQPNMGRALLLFGNYKGTVKHDGWFWTNPFYTKTPVSLRAMTLNGERLKVNDSVGNPVEIACIVVWQVNDTYRALFEVDNYMQYVALQTETALRHSASTHPYDADEGMVSLVRNTDEVGDHLLGEIQDRLNRAGIRVLEARLSHLAYAPEIAGVMLRKQQAAAVIAARQRIVDGAVGMVEMALQKLDEHDVVQLDDERKAAMVSNLMVVLCSESAAQPVLNAGTLYP